MRLDILRLAAIATLCQDPPLEVQVPIEVRPPSEREIRRQERLRTLTGRPLQVHKTAQADTKPEGRAAKRRRKQMLRQGTKALEALGLPLDLMATVNPTTRTVRIRQNPAPELNSAEDSSEAPRADRQEVASEEFREQVRQQLVEAGFSADTARHAEAAAFDTLAPFVKPLPEVSGEEYARQSITFPAPPPVWGTARYIAWQDKNGEVQTREVTDEEVYLASTAMRQMGQGIVDAVEEGQIRELGVRLQAAAAEAIRRANLKMAQLMIGIDPAKPGEDRPAMVIIDEASDVPPEVWSMNEPLAIPEGWCPICGGRDGEHKPGCVDGSEGL